MYTEASLIARKRHYNAVIQAKVSIDSIIYFDAWRGYNALMNVGYSRHFRVRHGENKFARDGDIVIFNGIESFWRFAKPRFTKFNGSKSHFDLKRMVLEKRT